jgi:hypothetical protein
VAIGYILLLFGIILPVLVCCTKKKSGHPAEETGAMGSFNNFSEEYANAVKYFFCLIEKKMFGLKICA